MLVNHLGHCVSEQHNILVKRLNLALQFDSIDEINRNRHMLATENVEKGILQKLAFVVHDMVRV